jgi:hypothetical protein
MAGSPSIAGDRIGRRTIQDVDLWVTEITTTHVVNQQNKIINFLLIAFGGLLFATMAIFYLQGFQCWGFHLDGALLKWLGGATIGEIAGLLALTLGAVFKKLRGC